MFRRGAAAVLVCLIFARMASAGPATMTVKLDGKVQTLTAYRVENAAQAVILSSGDLGWAGFVVDVAEFLAGQRIAVLGLDSKAYLESFTVGSSSVDPARVPAHFEQLAATAARTLGIDAVPVLMGISEGAGLSVMAAADASRKSRFGGVIVLGLPGATELGWHAWRDWTTWITKLNPAEPLAESAAFMSRIAPLPFVSIQSTRDEFVPLETAKALFAAANAPKRLYLINASNHRFSDKRDEVHARIMESLRWIWSLPIDRR